MYKVLFVCLGNICRSSMAEGVFRQLVHEAGRDDEFEIDSAGTSSWHIGEPPDEDAQATILARGIDISNQRARQLTTSDFQTFDLIVGMDAQNKAKLLSAVPQNGSAEISLLLDYAPSQSEQDVPDPWSQGQQAFDYALDLVEAGCTGLFNALPPKL